jgi:hypothetical protein
VILPPSLQGTSIKETHANEDFPWDDFDSEYYLRHNYGKLRDDDPEILGRLAEFFGSLIGHQGLRRGVDVGTGSNLYPVLALLPLCGDITLRERALTNCRWLRNKIVSYSGIWDPYWEELAKRPLYQPIGDPSWSVHERVHVERASIFDLPYSTYDIGTMFFVAESITERDDEFARATCSFLRSLRPNARLPPRSCVSRAATTWLVFIFRLWPSLRSMCKNAWTARHTGGKHRDDRRCHPAAAQGRRHDARDGEDRASLTV